MRIPNLIYYGEQLEFESYEDLANLLDTVDAASPFGKSLFAYVNAYHECIVKAFHDIMYENHLPAFVVGREYDRFSTSRGVTISASRLKAVEKLEASAPLLKRLKRKLDAHLSDKNESGVCNGDALLEEWTYQSTKNPHFARLILDLASADTGDDHREDTGGNIYLINDDIAQ